ncbi:hypothetical protein JGU71_14255 [Antrihabitans sp. YC3-6]|uniref:Uncharacterized protein n=1 Tax=Antrihabitans stalagmiti TaxID=2799499 RepID=A0A934U4R3_9NOCA|nr:hypothetical protein [Antrihabitans stalagmiti]MBJ8340053.1 hypothetical protein [Antrihabitans stalagmiti]
MRTQDFTTGRRTLAASALLALGLATFAPAGASAEPMPVAPPPITSMNAAPNVAFSQQGGMFIADAPTNQVVHMTATARPSTLPFGPLAGPMAVTANGAGDVFVADTGHNRVLGLAAGTTTPFEVPIEGLVAPQALGINSLGELVVTDSVRVQAVKIERKPVAGPGDPGFDELATPPPPAVLKTCIGIIVIC